jgi:preprotein translocase subunit YajC
MDPTLILFAVVAVVLIFLMFRNSRRNKARQEELKTQMVPGAEIMTNFGLFGKLLSVDELSNVAEIETSPGVIVKVHRQTLSKVVTPEEAGDSDAPRSVEEAMAIANREAEEREAASKIDAEAPEYGERLDDPITKATTKRAPRAPKKTDN